MTTTQTYDALRVMDSVKAQISGRWDPIMGTSTLTSGDWKGWVLTIPAGILRMTTEDPEGDLRIHVHTDRGVLRYTMDLSQVPWRVVLAAVQAAIDSMVGRVR